MKTGRDIAVFAILLVAAASINAAEQKEGSPSTCAGTMDSFFADEVWTKVGAQSCLTCHKAGGDGEKSQFILRDPTKSEGAAQAEVLRHNREMFAKIARLKEGDQFRLLVKVTGGLEHGGADVLKPDSTGYRILAEFVRCVNDSRSGKPATEVVVRDKTGLPFFDGIVMLDNRRLLRRATLSLAGRLPTDTELSTVASQGLPGLPAILDEVMKEDAFYDRLREAFNDIFLTVGYGDGAESALSYDHFSETRHWTQKHDLNHIADEKERQKARYKLADDYRKALLGEPMKLIEHIVRNDRPFTEIVTADYIMVTPYTARGYGIYDQLRSQFKNPDDPFEYIPVKLKALVGRNRNEDQESATGFYPHAGLLSTFQYLRRYPTVGSPGTELEFAL